MAADTSGSIEHWLKLDIQFIDYLGNIRHWNNLEMAMEQQSIWVKGFTAPQLESVALKSIPYIHLYYCNNQLLFPINHLLPERNQPALQWMAIEKALPLESPDINFNFFGIEQQYQARLITTDTEQQASYLLVDIADAALYIENAAASRLSCLQWMLVNNNEVLFSGKPLLPLQGQAYWQLDRFILPLGYTIEFTMLAKKLADKTDPSGTKLIWWIDAQQYCLLAPETFQALSISSWRQTMNLVS